MGNIFVCVQDCIAIVVWSKGSRNVYKAIRVVGKQKHSPKPFEMNYSEVGTKREVVAHELRVLMQEESAHLNISMKSYKYIKGRKFCSNFWSKNCSNFEPISVLIGGESRIVINMKVVGLSLRFPTTLNLPNSEVCSLIYKFLNKDNCCCNLRTDRQDKLWD